MIGLSTCLAYRIIRSRLPTYEGILTISLTISSLNALECVDVPINTVGLTARTTGT